MPRSECNRAPTRVPLVLVLLAFSVVSMPARAATSPTVAKADRPTTAIQATAAPTTAPLVRDADLSLFFPPKTREGNAASAYLRAFEIFAADRDRTRFSNQWEVLLDRRLMRNALDQISSGALCDSCDFLPHLPDDLSRRTKFPYLLETHTLAKLLATRFDREWNAKQTSAALTTARTLMAFGRHLRGSALIRDQEIQGTVIEGLAVSCFHKALGPKSDPVTSAKLTAITQLLEGSRLFIMEALTSHGAAGVTAFSADLAWLRSPHPVLRCDAIVNMAEETFPPEVLVKPTPAIDLRALLEKLEQATTPTQLRVRREEVERRVPWPRKGVRSSVTAEDVQRLREILGPVAQSDPDRRVRTLAQRFLDALVEPKPTPRPRPGDRPTSPPPQIPPPPRPPRLPTPPQK